MKTIKTRLAAKQVLRPNDITPSASCSVCSQRAEQQHEEALGGFPTRTRSRSCGSQSVRIDSEYLRLGSRSTDRFTPAFTVPIQLPVSFGTPL